MSSHENDYDDVAQELNLIAEDLMNALRRCDAARTKIELISQENKMLTEQLANANKAIDSFYNMAIDIMETSKLIPTPNIMRKEE